MKKLIEALQIFLKYKDETYPTNCEHDELCIMAVTFDEVSVEDRNILEELGFFWSDSDECWKSFHYGSA